MLKLSCGHDFCTGCFTQHVGNEMRKEQEPWCPTCRQPLGNDSAAQPIIRVVAEEVQSEQSDAQRLAQEQEIPRTWWQRQMEAHRWRRLARKSHLKYCPGCSKIIEKNGGCNSMTCRCGHRFRWDKAKPVAPCHHCHAHDSKFSVWGSCCPSCTVLAKTQLVALRTVVAISAVPVGAAVAAVAVPVLPIVGICRAVKKHRRRRRMRFSLSPQSFSDSIDWHPSLLDTSFRRVGTRVDTPVGSLMPFVDSFEAYPERPHGGSNEDENDALGERSRSLDRLLQTSISGSVAEALCEEWRQRHATQSNATHID